MLQKIKLKVLSALSFIKKYWGLLLVGAASMFALVFAKNKLMIIDQLTKDREELHRKHQQEIEELTRIHNQDVAERARIESEYRSTIETINRTHAEALENLSRSKQQELRIIIAETNNNPELMAERVNSLFGFRVLNNTTSNNNP